MKKYLIILINTLIAHSIAFAQQPNTFFIDLNHIAANQDSICEIKNSKEYNKNVLFFHPNHKTTALTIVSSTQEVDWKSKKYLVLDVLQKKDYSGIIYIDFYKKGSSTERIVQQGGEESRAQITPKIGVLPYLRTQVIFPLSFLDGQEIFMKRFPRQLKGTVLGRRLALEDVGQVKLRVEPFIKPGYVPEIQIAAIFITDTVPAPLPKTEFVVDEFGQWAARDWKGKIKSEAELKSKLKNLEASAKNSSFPQEWSKYGGWKNKPFKATGFFRTHNDGKRWWLVDPDGYAFISAGIDCINSNASGAISGNEDLFKWLPDKKDSLYKSSLNSRRGVETADFLVANLVRVYGKNWKSKWEEITSNLIRKYRINTVANWSDVEFARKSGIPYVLPLQKYPTTDIKLFRDFPDVFDPAYKTSSVEYAKQLEPYKNDPYLIGYFLSNEPHWAFGAHIIAFEMFGTNQTSYSKKQLIKWLEEKYEIQQFNKSWGLSLTGFQELQNKIFKDISELSNEAVTDLKEFSGLLVDEYVKQVCDEVKKVDPNHLNLGLRYAWISSDLCYRAGAYFDVFSVNGYSFPGPPATDEIAKRSGKPVMIGEFHFGSTDKGLPANGIQGVENQKARGEAYRYYLEQGFARPEIIGLHYFQWNDQPVLGRFDGENYNIGLFDICNQPYDEMIESVQTAHENLYKVATGEQKPYSKVVKKVPQIFY